MLSVHIHTYIMLLTRQGIVSLGINIPNVYFVVSLRAWSPPLWPSGRQCWLGGSGSDQVWFCCAPCPELPVWPSPLTCSPGPTWVWRSWRRHCSSTALTSSMSTLPAQCGKTSQVLPPGLGTRNPSLTWVSKVQARYGWKKEAQKEFVSLGGKRKRKRVFAQWISCFRLRRTLGRICQNMSRQKSKWCESQQWELVRTF